MMQEYILGLLRALSHLYCQSEGFDEFSDFGRYDAINILKFSKVETFSFEPTICPF